MNKIIAIIPTYNKKREVKHAITSLLSQTVPLHTIFIVDNASTDGTSVYLRNFINKENIKNIKIIENKTNEGVTGGRNKGIQQITNENLVLFFDHDMVAHPKLIAELCKSMEKESVGITTPKIYYWEQKDVIWSAGTDVNQVTGQTIFRGGLENGQYDTEEQVAVAPAVLMVKKSLLDTIGGFDDTYFATYEDTDFCFRAREKGFNTLYIPTAIAWHKIPFDSRLSDIRLLERSYWVARNRIIFMKKYGKNFIIFLSFIPIFFLYYLLLSCKYKNPGAIWRYISGSISGIKYIL